MSAATGFAPNKEHRNLSATNPLRLLEQRMNRLLGENLFPLALFGEPGWAMASWTPSCDIYETPAEFVIKADLPGLKGEDISVTLENNALIIRGERRFEEETPQENYHRIERTYGEFTRSFTLPANIDLNQIGVVFANGVLRLTLPKLEQAKAKQLEIKLA